MGILGGNFWVSVSGKAEAVEALGTALGIFARREPQAVLGKLADHTSIGFVYHLCAFLPAIGLLAVFLPKMPQQLR